MPKEQAMKKLALALKIREQMRGKKLDYYWCGFCKGFHLTSNVEDAITAEE